MKLVMLACIPLKYYNESLKLLDLSCLFGTLISAGANNLKFAALQKSSPPKNIPT